jgi:predicted porin
MKKSLFALAAMGAFAGAAQAQSSVTVYGILDVGYLGSASRSPAVTSTVQGTGPTTVKSQNSQFGQSGQTSSRLGFRGTEDLGGGTAAYFTLELGVQPQGTTWAPNNRQTFVGLSQKGLGQASIGTQYTALWLNALNPTDPGQGNNVAGSIIRPVGVNASQDGQGAASTAVTILTTNSLFLQTERIGGFRLAANYITNGTDTTLRNTNAITSTTSRLAVASTATGGQNDMYGYSIAADYQVQKLMVTAGWTSLKQEQSVLAANNLAQVSWANAFPSTPVTVGSTSNTTDAQIYAGAVYDFGILKAYANYVNRKITSITDSNVYFKRTGQQLGVRGNLTKTVEGFASAGTGRYTSFGTGEPTANIVAYQIGANYWLSKRTNLYAIGGHSQTSSVNGSTVVGANAGSAITGYAVGVRHTF